ncbi:MAG: hypothetical protein ACI8UO_006689 [Verrucomicrobiales bacterium]|jgi:hypothetical protein
MRILVPGVTRERRGHAEFRSVLGVAHVTDGVGRENRAVDRPLDRVFGELIGVKGYSAHDQRLINQILRFADGSPSFGT